VDIAASDKSGIALRGKAKISSLGETRKRGCEWVVDSDIKGSSTNPWEFITRSVPKEARRAVNRWKGLAADVSQL
jgi:hypothetical protein